MTRLVDISGQRFGRLMALHRAPPTGADADWVCLCDCGATTTTRGTRLRRGATQSCGCLQKERTIAATVTRVAAGRSRGRAPRASQMLGGVPCWQCSRCKLWLPAESYFSRPASPNGLTTQCRSCHSGGSIRTRNPDLARDTNRAYMRRARAGNIEKFREREREASRKRKATNKARARQLLNAAVRRGEVAKLDSCERCGATGKLHGHHWSYELPLDVKWLCPPCHGLAHRKTDAGREPAGLSFRRLP